MRILQSDDRGYAMALAVAILVVAVSGCARSQLLAPTNSTIVISAPDRVLPLAGRTDITAQVTDQNGAPVPNGTIVRFTATLGTVNPFEAETRNGLAVTAFTAGTASGVAEIRATSGGVGTTSTGSATNVLQITIGTAAVSTVTLRANPASLGSTGGVVELIAGVTGENGRALSGIAVTFTANQGTLSPATATTNSDGEARASLTTSQSAVVTATAGTKSSPNVTIAVQSTQLLAVAMTASPGSSVAGVGNTTTFTAAVRPATGGADMVASYTWDFGDSTSATTTSETTTHIYGSNGARTATVVVRTTDGRTATGRVEFIISGI
jgi:hypothetical protein